MKNLFLVGLVVAGFGAVFMSTPVYADAAEDYCKSEYPNTTLANYNGCVAGYRDTDYNCSQILPAGGKEACEAGKGAADEAAGGSGDADGSDEAADEVVCSAGALGWVICPAMAFMADAVEKVAEILGGYLAFNPFSGQNNAIRTIWSNILNVANILLAVAFLVVVFSQSTSLGLSNYGIKRMLPRIIAAAILMNLSYFICQILVDISNIAGVGITGLVTATTGQTFAQSVADVGPTSQALVATGIIAVLLFFFLIPVVLAFLAVLFTIAARNAIIVLLVIIAPLAFAAWVLPNTEKYFKKWWELLLSMLVLYPMVMVVFSASIVAANAIMSTTPSNGTGDVGEELNGIIALLVLAMPLFALPFLFKTAGGALGRINALTQQRLQQGANSKASQAVRKKAGSYAKFGTFAAGAGIAKAGNKASRGRVFNPNKPGRLTRAYRGTRAMDKAIETSLTAREQGREAQTVEQAARMGGTRLGGAALGGVGGQRYQEVIVSQIAKAQEERIRAIVTRYERGGQQGSDASSGGYLNQQFNEAISSGNTEQAQAVINRLSNLGGSGRDRVAKMVQGTTVSDQSMKDAITKSVSQDNYGTLVSKRGDVAKGGYDASGNWSSSGNLGKLSTEQLASQDKLALKLHYGDIKQVEAARILSEPELRSKVAGAEELAILTAAATPGGAPNPYPPTPADYL